MDSKRRRVQKLTTIRGITDSALARVLEALDGQVVQPISRRWVSQAAIDGYDAELQLQLQLPLNTGGFFAWDVARPSTLVQRCVKASPALRRLFARCPSSPAAPWRIILAHDEITPGNLLRPQNKKKFTSFYMSFLDLSHVALRLECCWMPLGLIRTSVLDTIEGKLSCALRYILRAILMQEGSNLVDGIVLELDDGPTHFFA